MTYECFRCGYETSRKDAFRRHLIGTEKKPRIKHCKIKYLNVDPHEILEKYDTFLDEYKEAKEAGPSNTTEVWKCDKCNMQTPYKGNYQRHIKNKVCLSESQLLLEEIKELKENHLQLLQLIATNPATTTGGSIDLIASTVEGDVNQTNQLNNVVNNINNNGTMPNEFGKLDVGHITVEEWYEFTGQAFTGFHKFMERVYKGNPKNFNVFLRNRSRNDADVYRPPHWETLSLDDVCFDIVQSCADEFSDFIENEAGNLPYQDYHNMDKALTDIQKTNKGNRRAREQAKRIFKNTRYNKEVNENYRKVTGSSIPDHTI